MTEVELTFAREFKEDLEHQVDRLEHEHPNWIPKLERGLGDSFALLQGFPRAGEAMVSSPLRKLVLQKIPFVIWYAFDEGSARVELLRLFHARQARSR